MLKNMEIDIVPVWELIKNIPEEDLSIEIYQTICYHFALELSYIFEIANKIEKPSITFLPFKKSGEHFMAEFWLNDLSLSKKDQYNFYGQNTSQWKYAGCIRYKDNKVSTHH